MRLLSVAVSLWLICSASAQNATPYQIYGDLVMVDACTRLMDATANFCNDDDSLSGVKMKDDNKACWECPCTNLASMATLIGCMNYGKAPSKVPKQFSKYCKKKANVTLTLDVIRDAYQNYTNYGKRTEQIEGFSKTKKLNIPVILNNTQIKLYEDSSNRLYGNFDRSLIYGSLLLAFWGFVFLIESVSFWSKRCFPKVIASLTGTYTNLFRRYITLPATKKRSKTSDRCFFIFIQALIPSRKETIIIGMFYILTVIFNVFDIYTGVTDPRYPTRGQALARYVSDRTGITATVLVPLLILFSGRNNFLQWITGLHYSTFMMYHRWLARMIFLLVSIHGITVTVALSSFYKHQSKTINFFGAGLATACASIIMVQGMLFLRRRWYEIFLITHILMAVGFIAGSWIHVDDFGYVWFFWCASAIWVFDRVARLTRLFLFGAPLANVTLLEDEALKVVVPKPKHWKPVAGGFGFVYFLEPGYFWQSHPFTFYTSTYAEVEDSVVFYCKIKGGITHSLHRKIANSPGNTIQIRVAVEGPYGETSPSQNYDNAVFIATGNGIPGMYSEALNLALRSKTKENQLLKLYWVIRDYDSVKSFFKELVELRKTRVKCIIYVTRPLLKDVFDEIDLIFELYGDWCGDWQSDVTVLDLAPQKEEKNGEGEKDQVLESLLLVVSSNSSLVPLAIEELNHVEFHEGRPDIDNIVKHEITESAGSTCFVTCGHPAVVDDLRKSVVQHLDYRPGKRVDYYEQLEVWA